MSAWAVLSRAISAMASLAHHGLGMVTPSTTPGFQAVAKTDALADVEALYSCGPFDFSMAPSTPKRSNGGRRYKYTKRMKR
jgi:hypothetical protein